MEKAALFALGSLKGVYFLADVNECVDPSPCPSGRCVNTLGSYKCVSCGDGYRARNGRCIGELLGLSLCSTPWQCSLQVSEGAGAQAAPFPCGQPACMAGTQHPRGLGGGDSPEHPPMPCCPVLCHADVDECLVEGTCAHGRCVNLDGSFRCSCYRGYEVAPDKKSCQGTREPGPDLLKSHTPSPQVSLGSSWGLCQGPSHCVGWFSQHICYQTWLLYMLPTHPTLPHVPMQTSTSAHPRLPVPLDSASTPRAPTPAWLVTLATLSPEMAAHVKVSLSQGQRNGFWRKDTLP